MKQRLLLGALGVVGCVIAAPVLAQGTVAGILAADWDTLDPHKTRTTHGFQMAMALYDRVVALDSDGNVIPYLAESWVAGPDSVTMTIRSGATCTDGTPLDAAAVAANLTREADPDAGIALRTRTFGAGPATITHDDAAQTVSIQLAQPNGDMMLSLAMAWSSIICPAGLADPDALQGTPQGSGPFTLTDSRRGDIYVMSRRNDHAWGPDLGELPGRLPDTFTLRVSPNATTSANLFLTNEVNIVSLQGRDIERLATESGLGRIDMTLFGTDGMMMSRMPDRITSEQAVRRALAHAVDREGFKRAFAFGFGEVVNTLTTPSMQCYDAEAGANVPVYDPSLSEALLAEAGFARNASGIWERDGEPLRIRIIGHGGQNAGPEFLMESWRAIGIDASLVMNDFGGWFETYQANTDWDVTIHPHNSTLPSPSLFVAAFTGAPQPGGGNYIGAENPRYVAATSAALAAGPDERCALWAEAQRVLIDDLDTFPLVARVASTFTRGVGASMAAGTVVKPLSLRLLD